MLISCLISLNLLVPRAQALAKSAACEEFSLETPGGSMAHVSPRDQGDSGTCYAHANVGAIDAWRMSNDPPKNEVKFQSSPHALAVEYVSGMTKTNRKNRDDATHGGSGAIEGGFGSREEIKAAKKYGVCSYEALGANFLDANGKSQDKMFWANLTQQYEQLNKSYIKALIDGDQDKQSQILSQGQAGLAAALCLGGLRDRQVFTDLKDVRDFIVQKDAFAALKKVTDQICAGHNDNLPEDFPDPIMFDKDKIPQALRTYPARKEIMGKMVQAMFNFKNRQPIMVSLCGGAIQNFSYEGLSDMDGNSGGCPGHEVLLIGRKKMPDGTCGFLLRNSWGADQDTVMDRDSVDDNGNILMPEQTFYKNTYDLAVLPPRGETYAAPKGIYDVSLQPAYGGFVTPNMGYGIPGGGVAPYGPQVPGMPMPVLPTPVAPQPRPPQPPNPEPSP